MRGVHCVKDYLDFGPIGLVVEDNQLRGLINRCAINIAFMLS
jgi:hypothetical protein